MLILSDDVKDMLEERGILETDVETVVSAAESSGVKMVHTSNGHSLAKSRLGNFTVYAEYVMTGEDAEIFDVYSHRVNLAEELA